MTSYQPVHTGHEMSRTRAHEGERGDRAPTPSAQALQALLPDLLFPSTRADILTCARSHHADRRMMTQLERLPEMEYPDAAEVSRQLSQFG